MCISWMAPMGTHRGDAVDADRARRGRGRCDPLSRGGGELVLQEDIGQLRMERITRLTLSFDLAAGGVR